MKKFYKNEVTNARVYGMDDITRNFVTECLIKVQTLFNQCAEKKSAGWIDKIYQKNIIEYSASTQIKTTAE